MSEDPRLGLPSASKLEIVCECPGSENLVKKIGGQFEEITYEEDITLTNRGIRIHKARETGDTTELDPEDFRLYQNGLVYETKLLEKWRSTFALPEPKEGQRELRLYLHDRNGEVAGSGQLDVHFISNTFAHIIDWKTGFCSNLTGAKGNWQLRMQAVLLWLDHPHITDIRVAFAKPMMESGYLDFCDYSEADLMFSFNSILFQLWWSTQADAWRRAGAHCRWCPARNGHCPEALAYALLPSVIVKNVFSKKGVPAAVNEVTPQDLYAVWRKGAIIRNILDGVTSHLKRLPEELLTELGLRLAPGRETPEITKIKEAMEVLQVSHGWPPEVIYGSLKFVTGRMAEYLMLKGMDEKSAKAWISETMAPFIELKVSEKILKEI